MTFADINLLFLVLFRLVVFLRINASTRLSISSPCMSDFRIKVEVQSSTLYYNYNYSLLGTADLAIPFRHVDACLSRHRIQALSL